METIRPLPEPNYRFGRLIWKKKGNTPEQDLELGRNNFLGLFYKRYPEFADLFPLDENGMITGDKREAAKHYLDNLMGKGRGRFTLSIAPAVYDRKITPYFEGSARVVIMKSFQGLGIEFEENTISDSYEIQVGEQQLTAVNQDIGLNNLSTYLRNSGEELNTTPFVVKRENDRNTLLNVGLVGSKKVTYALNQRMQDFLRLGGKLAFFPRISPDGRYRWCDIYQLDEYNKVDLNNPIQGAKIDQEKQRISSADWHGYEIELFWDYLQGEKDVMIHELQPFRVQTTITRVPILTRRGKQIAIHLHGTGLQSGQTINCVPRFDKKTGYSWLEGYVDEGEKQRQVFTRRFTQGNLELSLWPGPSEQTIIDWIQGELTLDKIGEIIFPLNKAKKKYIPFPNQKALVFEFKDSAFSSVDSVRFVLKEDNLYKWIEVYDAQNTHTQQVLASYQIKNINNEFRVEGQWAGPEKQRYIDFLDGNLEFNDLPPFRAKVKKNAIYMFSYYGKAINLPIFKGLFSESATRTLIVPSLSEHNELIVTALDIESGKPIRSYIWNSQREAFDIADNNTKFDWSHLTTIEQWQSEYQKHPDWTGIIISQMYQHPSPEARSFSHNLRTWATKISDGDIKYRDELITQVIPKNRPDKWIQLSSIEDWLREFKARPEWQNKSSAQMKRDHETGGAGFVSSFTKWVKRQTIIPEEQLILQRMLFPEVQQRLHRRKNFQETKSQEALSPEEAGKRFLESLGITSPD